MPGRAPPRPSPACSAAGRRGPRSRGTRAVPWKNGGGGSGSPGQRARASEVDSSQARRELEPARTPARACVWVDHSLHANLTWIAAQRIRIASDSAEELPCGRTGAAAVHKFSRAPAASRLGPTSGPHATARGLPSAAWSTGAPSAPTARWLARWRLITFWSPFERSRHVDANPRPEPVAAAADGG